MGGISIIVLAAAAWVFYTIKSLGPVVGVLAVVAAVISVAAFVVAARVLARSDRRWVRVVADILIGLAIAGTLISVGVAVVSFGVSGYLNSLG